MSRRRARRHGCHGGTRRRCSRRAKAAGKSETLERYAADYPAGPHDQPQSMCPAFGSLRVGLRMRRTATILSGSACCVYGLTFTSHFYGARRTVGYVPFNSETLVTGKLFEDIREAVFKLAEPDDLRRHRHHQSLRADRLRRAAATCCRRRSTACASSASTCPASACRPMPRPRTCWPAPCCAYARKEAEQGPVQAPRGGTQRTPDRHADRRDVPGRSRRHRRDAGAAGPGGRPGGADARMARALCRARLRGGRRDPSVLHRLIREFEAAGRPIVGSAPGRHRRHRGLARSDRRRPATSRRDKIDAAKNRVLPAIQGGAGGQARSTAASRVSGYEGSELLVARLLIESGADVPYVGTACPRTRWSRRRPRMARGQRRPCPVPRLAGAGPGGDAASSSPTSPSAPRRWCRRPRSWRSRRSTSPT